MADVRNASKLFYEALRYPRSTPLRFFVISVLFYTIATLFPLAALKLRGITGPNPPGDMEIIWGALALFTGLGFVVFLNGYLLSILRTSVRGDGELPAIGSIPGIFVDGFRLTGVLLLYVFVPLLIAVLFSQIGAHGISDGGSPSQLAVATSLLAILTMFVAFYLLPSAVTVVADDGARALASPRKITSVGASGTYIAASSFVYFASMGVIVTVQGVITQFGSLGLVLGPFILFYILIVWTRLYGLVYLQISNPEAI